MLDPLTIRRDPVFLERLLESITDGLVILDRELRIVFWNESMVRLYHIPPEEVLGLNMLEAFPSLVAEGVGEGIRQVATGESEHFFLAEFKHRTRRMGEVVENFHVYGVRDEQGGPAGALIINQDITERYHMERMLRQSEKLAGMGQILSGLAHEIGSPLAVVQGNVELLREELPPDSPARPRLEVVIAEVGRITALLQQALKAARPSEPAFGLVSLNTLLREVVELGEAQFAKVGVRTVWELAEDLPEVLADDGQLREVFFNLVLNAWQAMPDGGTLTLRSEVVRDDEGRPQVSVAISDTGAGIEPQHLAFVFEPFFSTKSHSQGTGLGLAIAHRIVQAHQGQIVVYSEPGHGSTFEVRLPPAGAEPGAPRTGPAE